MAHGSRREGAFAAFAGECHTPLLRTALLLTGAQESAEQLVSSVLLKVYLRWDELAEGRSPYLYAREALLRGYTSWRRARRPLRAEQPHVGLSRREWAVLVLSRREGLPPEEIAEALGWRVDRVNSVCRREHPPLPEQTPQERPYDVGELLARGRRARWWRDGAAALGILVLVVGCGVAAAGVAGVAVRGG